MRAIIRQLAAEGWSDEAIASATHQSIDQVRQITGASVLSAAPARAAEQAEAAAATEHATDCTSFAEARGASKEADNETGIRAFLSLAYNGNRQASDRAYWTELLRLTSGNVTAAAEIARCSREHAHRIIRRLNIERPRPGPGAWKRLREGRKTLDM